MNNRDLPGRDFRDRLYADYASITSSSVDLSPSRCRWLDHKLLPHFDGLDPASPILELGCGTGAFLEYLGRRGFTNISGVDVSRSQVAAARQAGRPVDLGSALVYLREASDTYQCIVCIDVLEHMTKSELLDLLPLVHSRLRAGGRLIVQTVNASGLFPFQVAYGDLTHMTFMNEQSITQLLRWSGFDRIRLAEAGPMSVGLKGATRWSLWRLARGVAKAIRLAETGKQQHLWTENMIVTAFKDAEKALSFE